MSSSSDSSSSDDGLSFGGGGTLSTPGFRKAVAILPKIGGLASLIGSSYIVYSLFYGGGAGGNLRRRSGDPPPRGSGSNGSDGSSSFKFWLPSFWTRCWGRGGGSVQGRSRRNLAESEAPLQLTSNRIILLLSISDIISSIGFIASTWAVPKLSNDIDVAMTELQMDPQYYKELYPWSYGNRITCNIQGFLLRLGISSSVLFSLLLAFHSVAIIRYSYTERQLQRLETYIYPTILIYSMGSAMVLLFLGYYNVTPSGLCFINTYPFFCSHEFDYMKNQTLVPESILEAYCEQNLEEEDDSGDDEDSAAIDYQFYSSVERKGIRPGWMVGIFWQLLIGVTFLCVVICMMIVFCTVRKQELRVQRYSVTLGTPRQGQLQRKVIEKGTQYIAIFLLCYIPPFFFEILFESDGIVDLIRAVLLPSQGFFNALIYSGIAGNCLNCCICCFGPSSSTSTSDGSSTNTNRNMYRISSHINSSTLPNQSNTITSHASDVWIGTGGLAETSLSPTTEDPIVLSTYPHDNDTEVIKEDDDEEQDVSNKIRTVSELVPTHIRKIITEPSTTNVGDTSIDAFEDDENFNGGEGRDNGRMYAKENDKEEEQQQPQQGPKSQHQQQQPSSDTTTVAEKHNVELVLHNNDQEMEQDGLMKEAVVAVVRPPPSTTTTTTTELSSSPQQ